MNKSFFALSSFAVFALASCGPVAEVEAIGMGYGLVHSHYVGVVEVKTLNDKVTEISIDEYFLPYNWGKVTVTEPTEDTLIVVGARGSSTYAEFVKVGDKVFTGSVIGTGTAQSIRYSSNGIDDIDAWVAIEANAKWYVEQIEAEDYGYLNQAGQPATFVKGDASSKVSMIKSQSGYWSSGLGWLGNIAEVEALLLDTMMDLDVEDFSINSEGYWASDDITTGVTMVDFKDYIAVALRAYANRVIVE
jgi:hypothetical protein